MRRIWFFILVAILIIACTKEQQNEMQIQGVQAKAGVEQVETDNLEPAEIVPNQITEKKVAAEYQMSAYVSSHTSGTIKPNSPIIINFTYAMIKNELIGTEAKRISLKSTPKFDAKMIWDTRTSLKIIPQKDLKQGQDYSLTVDIQGLLPEDKIISPLTIEFHVVPQRLTKFKAEFVKDALKKSIYRYKGTVGFSLNVDLDNLRQAASLKVRNKTIDLNWTKDGNIYYFQSENIYINEDKLPVTFKLNKRKVNLKQDFIKESSLYGLHQMAMILVSKDYDDQKPGIFINFSDHLDTNQTIDNFIQVEGLSDLSFTKMGDKVLVSGGFEIGKQYIVKIKKGIMSQLGLITDQTYVREISFSDKDPQIRFVHDGVFLPTSNNKRLQFYTINVKRVDVTIKKVFENNLNYFLQRQSMNSSKTNSETYYNNFNYLGQGVLNRPVNIKNKPNEWNLQELDLSSIIKDDDHGLYLVEINFNRDDITYRGEGTGNDDYYTNPTRNGYYYKHGKISKPLIVSNIGLTLKKGEKYVAYATNIVNGKPLKDCQLTLISRQNQVVSSGKTDGDGKLEFKDVKGDPTILEAKKGSDRSFIRINEMQWNSSTFSVNGDDVSSKKLRVYTYTERGVYRPGDQINLSIVLRNSEDTFSGEHPIKIKIYNPKNQIVKDETIKGFEDGFCNYNFSTETTDMTGNWQARIDAGGKVFYHTLKIETVVAERLKIKLTPEAEKISSDQEIFNLELQANYLFGAAAKNLKADVDVEIFTNSKIFKIEKYRKFTFRDAAIKFKKIEKNLYSDKLDDNGHTTIKWTLPKWQNSSTGLIAKFTSEVSENGGRSSKHVDYLKIDPFTAYVGMATDFHWLKIGKPHKIETVLLDPEGEQLVGEDLRVRVYKNSHHWWWDYYNNQGHFRTDVETELIREFKLSSGENISDIEYTPQERGKYLIEISHLKDGEVQHTASKFFWSSYWGRANDMKSAGRLDLVTNKAEYTIGETASIKVDAPEDAIILVSLEKGDKIIKDYWKKSKGKNSIIEVPITKEMVPNAYVSLSIIQPHKQTQNDRPLRMYGIVPLMVTDKGSKQEIELKVPELLKPNTKFSCEIQSSDKEKTQFTIAVVDEGLLSITDFQTPNPWERFYKKQRHNIQTSDNYNYFIGANKEDIYGTYSIGGDMEFSAKEQREKMLNPQNAERFKPVSMFQGPFSTDKNGYAKIDFTMPEYEGAVRIMVISTKKGSYGSAEKLIPVKRDITIMPTIPRVLAPADKFILPVELFTDKDNIGEIKLSCELTNIVNHGKKSYTFTMIKGDEKHFEFDLEAAEIMGIGKINLILEYRGERYDIPTEISIRPNSTWRSKRDDYVAYKKSEVKFTVPEIGLSGTNDANIVISGLPKIDLSKRLSWLIRYPYGCVEQTVSAVFPQIYLKDFVANEKINQADVTKNINFGIARLQKYQVPRGGLSYWPGGDYVSEWGTNYATHFLIEAKKAGYFVQDDLYKSTLDYQYSSASKYQYTTKYKFKLYYQVYRLYLLAKAKRPNLSAMNYVRENFLNQLDDPQRWVLAAAYKLAGAGDVASDISATTGIVVRDYHEMSGSYGSAIRDRAMILEAMIVLGEDEKSLSLYNSISESMSNNRRYTTHETGFCLLALGHYIQEHFNSSIDSKIKESEFVLLDPQGKEIKCKGDKILINRDLQKYIGQELTLISKTNKRDLYLTVTGSGIPLFGDETNIFEGVKISSSWKDENGVVIYPKKLKQGDIFYQTIRVKNLKDFEIKNLALVQILPSGWEIENERLTGEQLNESYNVEYKDIRDDRVMWFFNLRKYKQAEFKIKLRAVTQGEFYLPATNVEAMYDKRYRCIEGGGAVQVIGD